MSWKDESEPNIKYCLGATVGMVQDSSEYRALGTIDREPMEFESNIVPGFTTLQLVHEVRKFMSKMSEPEQCQGRLIFMSMFNVFYGDIKTMKRIVWLIPHLCLDSQKDFQQDVGHSSSDLGQRQSGIPPTEKDQEENGFESLN